MISNIYTIDCKTFFFFIAVCMIHCVHGRCVGPRECLCEDGWEGERCEQGIDQCVVRCALMTSINAVK